MEDEVLNWKEGRNNYLNQIFCVSFFFLLEGILEKRFTIILSDIIIINCPLLNLCPLCVPWDISSTLV